VLPKARPTGGVGSDEIAHTLANLLPGTAACRNRPKLIFANGFDEINACPGITY
jgi:hypothetical protein